MALLGWGCNQNDIILEISSLKNNVIQAGNINDYNKLILLSKKHNIDVSDVSRVMANTYNYPAAFYNVFDSYVQPSIHPDYYYLASLKPVDLASALYYLNKAYIKGEINSKKAVEYYLENGKDYFIYDNFRMIKLNPKYLPPSNE